MNIPRSEERFTPAAAGAREVARLYGAKVNGYIPVGQALDLAAERIEAHPAHEGGAREAMTAAGRLAMLHIRANEHGACESYYGLGQARRDYDRLRHK